MRTAVLSLLLAAACSSPVTTAPDAATPGDGGKADAAKHTDAKQSSSRSSGSGKPHVDAGTDATHPHDTGADVHHEATADVLVAHEAGADTGLEPDAHTDGAPHDALSDRAAHDATGDSGVCPVTDPVSMPTMITNAWKAPSDAGPPTTLATLAVDGCEFTLFYTASAPGGPAVFSIWLEKASPVGGVCASDKGVISIGTSYSDTPTGFLAANANQKLLAVVATYKYGVSGQDGQTSLLDQVDWAEGVVLRSGAYVVKGSAEEMMVPAVVATGLTVTGCNVTVTGQGTVESPTDAGSGGTFTATWANFLAEAEQQTEEATSSSQSN